MRPHQANGRGETGFGPCRLSRGRLQESSDGSWWQPMSRIHDALKKMETPQELLEEDSPQSRPSDGRVRVEVATASAAEWTFAPDTMIAFDGDGSQRAAEEFRGLRNRLEQLREKQNLRSGLVTSAVP